MLLQGKLPTHSSGSSSNHFHTRCISHTASIGREFICFSKLIVTSRTWGAGNCRRTNFTAGGGDVVAACPDMVLFYFEGRLKFDTSFYCLDRTLNSRGIIRSCPGSILTAVTSTFGFGFGMLKLVAIVLSASFVGSANSLVNRPTSVGT